MGSASMLASWLPHRDDLRREQIAVFLLCQDGGGPMTMSQSSLGEVLVRQARVDDSEALVFAYRTNRQYLAPFEPLRDENFYTVEGQAARLQALLAERQQERAYPYLIEVGNQIVGRVTVTNVSRGPFCSGSLGYWVAAGQAGRGVATYAVRHVLQLCFTTHDLHRIEAATLLDNVASQAVLRRTGFSLIGAAPGYLRIAGEWRDHPLFQRLSDS